MNQERFFGLEERTHGVSQSLIEQLQTFRRIPARGSPSLWIFLMWPLLASLHRNLNQSRRLMHGLLDFPIVSVSSVVLLSVVVPDGWCCLPQTKF